MTRKVFQAILFICVFSFSGFVDSAESLDRQADHEALRALRNRVVAAIEAQDVDALISCFAEDFAFTTSTQDILTSRSDVQQFIDRMFGGENPLIESVETEMQADVLTRFLAEGVGICYGTARDTYTILN